MRALVTGGAGFIGSHVGELLVRNGHEVLVLDNLATGSPGNLPAGAELLVADITDTAAVSGAMRGFAPQVVIHLAAQTLVAVSAAQPERDAAINIAGTLAVLRAAVEAGCGKVLFASSSTVYGEPTVQPVQEHHRRQPVSPYGVSKLAGEHYLRVLCEQHGIRHTALRLGNVYGPRDNPASCHVITAFVEAVIGGQPAVIESDGEQTKDYVYVGDVAAAFLAAVERGDGGVYNIGTGRRTSVNELLHLVCEVAGRSTSVRHAPARPGDVRSLVMDCAAAHRHLRWQPDVPLSEGVRMSVAARQARRSRDGQHAEPIAG